MKYRRTLLFWFLALLNLWFLLGAAAYASYDMGPEFPASLYPEYSNDDQQRPAKPTEMHEIEAQVKMGLNYLTGENGIIDEKQAFRWFKIAESEGSEEASVYLASMYYYGKGTKQNYDEALKRFSKAAESGNNLAQFNLHVMYDVGYGVLVDKQKALYWLKQSANNGFAPAQAKLGMIYKTGGPVERDLQKSMNWLRLAAEKGNKIGQYHLAKNYALGIGVEQNNFISYIWFNVIGKDCSSNQLEMQCPDFRNTIANTLSESELERAQQLIAIKKKNIAQNANSPTLQKVIIQ